MYCGNCGTQNDDRAMFCQNCGAKLEGGAGGNQNQQWQQNIDYSYQNEIPGQISIQGKKKGKLKILIPAIAVVAVVLILIFSLTGRRGYKKTVENYVQGALDGDIEKVVSVPRVISNCLPISTISISFVGSLSRSTILPASFAACVPLFIATPTFA